MRMEMIFSSSLYLKFRKRIYPLILAMVICFPVKAQQYNGMTGLIHIPSAEMGRPGDAHIGVHFVNKELMPDKFVCPDDDGNLKKYNSYSYYLNITPFNWLEVAYTCVLFKYNQPNRKGYKAKDRHFCIKVNPLKETKYTPSLAIGADDFLSSNLDPDKIQGYFANYWVSACKHLALEGHEVAVHIGYRYYQKEWNKKYQGLNGALTYSPAFARNTKAIVEYDGYHVNIGFNALLYRHLLMQASFTDLSNFSVGIAYEINLFYKNRK